MRLKKIKLHNIRSYLDEEIEFPEGSTLLSGQIGSGKTSILLAAEFALFGTKRSELPGSSLLRHGKDEGYVQLHMDINGKNIILKRNLKRKKDSIAQDNCLLKMNNVDYEYTPTEMKKKVLELLNYPQELITKNKSYIFRYTVYTPQEEMKQIILLDEERRLETLRKVFDIEKYEKIKNNSELFAKSLRSKSKELKASILNLDEKIKEQKEVKEAKQEVTNKISKKQKQLGKIEEEIKTKQKEIKKQENELKKINKMKTKLASTKSSVQETKKQNKYNRTELEKLKKDINKLKDKKTEIKKPKHTKQEIKNKIESLNKKNSELVEQITTFSNNIEKWQKILEKGLCDTCGQKVHDKKGYKGKIDQERKNLEKSKKWKKTNKQKLEKMNKKLEEIGKMEKQAEEQKFIRKQIKEKLERKNLLEKKIKQQEKEINQLKKNVEELKNKIDTKLEQKLKKSKKDMEQIQERRTKAAKIVGSMKQSLKDKEENIRKLEKEIKNMKEIKQKINRINKIENWLSNCFSPLMSTIEKYIMRRAHMEFNELFQQWFNILVEDESLNVKINKRFSPVVEQGGYETEFQNLSGGEKTSVALSYRLALNKVINEIMGKINTKDIIILDEPTDGFSTEQLEKIRDVLEKLNLRQTIIVSHEPKIDTFVENVINFHKENGVSSIMPA